MGCVAGLLLPLAAAAGAQGLLDGDKVEAGEGVAAIGKALAKGDEDGGFVDVAIVVAAAAGAAGGGDGPEGGAAPLTKKSVDFGTIP